MMSPGNLIGGPKAAGLKGARKQGMLGLETKMNFFDPHAEGINQAEMPGMMYLVPDKTEDQKILNTGIDPLEWKQEIDRVYQDLSNLEKDIEILVKQGGSSSIESFEECRRHIELIIEMCNDIRQSSHQQVRKVFASSAEKLDEDLQFIRKNEIRINKQNEKAILDLGQITQKKKKLATELRSLIQQVKDSDYFCKELQ
jgi:ElaB/YqjD/DUF883 family membrane-anchored ribosome-binding protein